MIKDNSKGSLVKIFFEYSIPCIVGMFLTSCITIIDGIFIGNKLGGHGLAAINLTVPVLYFFLGISIMLGLGGVTIATHSLGAKNPSLAKRRFMITLVTNSIAVIILVVFLNLFLDHVVSMLNASPEISGYVRDYLGRISVFYFFMMSNIIFAMFIRSEGKPGLSLFFGIAGNIINIILDYLFIFKFNWGMNGAALATGISILIPFILGCIYFISGKSLYGLYKFRWSRKDFDDLKNIIFNGSSEFISQISFCIATYLFNFIIITRMGIQGVAAFTIVGYVSFFEYMILTGIAQGLNPLISYSFGAKDNKTISYLLSIGLRAVFIIGFLVFLVSIIATESIAGLFAGNRTQMIKIASIPIKVFSIAFLINGYNFIASAYFTSLGEAKKSALISLLRSLVLISVFILVLPLLMGNMGIWMAVPVTELVTFGVSFYFIEKSKKLFVAATVSEY